MTYDFTTTHKGILRFLVFISVWAKIYSAEDFDGIADLTQNELLLPRAKLGEFCWIALCQENQFCNEEFICQCRPEYKVFNNDCLRISGENESCISHEDCWRPLICINGICRKSFPGSEFVTLAKICLVVTSVTIVAAAIFSSFYKCLKKGGNSEVFQRSSDTSSHNSVYEFRRQVINPRYLNEVQEDKPPSYEECICSTDRGVLTQPPPYVIFTNSDILDIENRPVIQSTNRTSVNSQNLTPLNVQNLGREINSDITTTQISEKIRPDA